MSTIFNISGTNLLKTANFILLFLFIMITLIISVPNFKLVKLYYFTSLHFLTQKSNVNSERKQTTHTAMCDTLWVLCKIFANPFHASKVSRLYKMHLSGIKQISPFLP